MAYKESWVVVNEVPSLIQTWGGWIDDPLPDGDSLIICITGNPGVTQFYYTFLDSLHQLLGVPIWIPCHAGHELPPSSTKLKLPKNPSIYNMAGQVAHKLSFVKQYVPANRNLYFIGHSLGAKIVSELLKDKEIAEHTKKCYLLMPTLEHIGGTPNGKFLSWILKYFMSTILIISWALSLLPDRCIVFLTTCWFLLSRQHQVDQSCMDAVCNLTRPRVLRNVFNLALDEMDKIKELDMQVLDQHWHKMKVYFAQTDGWAPLTYMESLKKAKPEIDITVLNEQFFHAFVLDSPNEMADMLAQQIKEDRLKG